MIDFLIFDWRGAKSDFKFGRKMYSQFSIFTYPVRMNCFRFFLIGLVILASFDFGGEWNGLRAQEKPGVANDPSKLPPGIDTPVAGEKKVSWGDEKKPEPIKGHSKETSEETAQKPDEVRSASDSVGSDSANSIVLKNEQIHSLVRILRRSAGVNESRDGEFLVFLIDDGTKVRIPASFGSNAGQKSEIIPPKAGPGPRPKVAIPAAQRFVDPPEIENSNTF